MRLAIITDSFPPLKNSGAIQVLDLSLEFVRQGHEVLVLTPSDEIASLYQLDESSEKSGLQVLRLKAPKMRGISYLRRVVSEFLMPFMMIRHLKQTTLDGNQFDGVITYAPSIFLGPLANWLKRKNSCKNYLIIRDIFPQWAVDVGLLSGLGLPYYLLKKVEQYLYSTADTIGAQTPANLAYFSDNVVDEMVTIEVLQNWLAKGDEKPCSIVIEETVLKGRKIFVYAGNIGDAQGLSIFIALAERMQKNSAVGFLFVGRGSAVSSLKQDIATRALDNVLFFDEIEPDEIPALYQQCDVGIISLDQRHKTHNIPGKFLSYMRAGLPVLAVINSGNDLEHIINDNGVGCVTTNHSVDHLTVLIEEVIDGVLVNEDVSEKCQSLYSDLFSPVKAVEQIIDGFV